MGKKKGQAGRPKQNPKVAASSSLPSKATTATTRVNIATSTDVPSAPNRPKNHLITDATSPFTFDFYHFGQRRSLTVDQTAGEETWPGGALWDVGVLMARLLVAVNSPPPPPSGGPVMQQLFIPRLVSPGVWGAASWKDRRVLELGCGVGLTGLVAAALGARAVLLTDLAVVVDRVTRPNIERASGSLSISRALRRVGGSSRAASSKGASRERLSAIPLCWGNKDDESAAASALDDMAPPLVAKSRSSRPLKKKGSGKKNGVGAGQHHHKRDEMTSPTGTKTASSREGVPDLVLIGDVAYQHKPGANSHFSALLSTLLRFTDDQTVVMFGTRMRMPASADLLDMFREHFDEIVFPRIEAHEIDAAFQTETLGRSHNITIHLLRRKNTTLHFGVKS